MGGVGSVCTELTVWEGKTMKTAVKHCVSSAYQIGTGGGVEGRRGLAPPPIRFDFIVVCYIILMEHHE